MTTVLRQPALPLLILFDPETLTLGLKKGAFSSEDHMDLAKGMTFLSRYSKSDTGIMEKRPYAITKKLTYAY